MRGRGRRRHRQRRRPHLRRHPDVFARFRRAVTDTGLYKDSDRLAIKDDRGQIRQSEYLYQGDVTAKINALTLELAAAEETYQKARRKDRRHRRQRQQWRDRAAACKAICEQYPQWSQIDTETADGHADRLREQYELLLAENPDLDALNARADECWSQIQKFMTRRGAIQTRRDSLDHRRTQLMDLQERLSPAFVSEPLTELLHRYAAALPVSLELLDPEPHRDALFTSIKKEREQLRESRRRSYDELARILNTFDTSFPDAIPNDSEDFDERVHDYVALCKHIDERELPEAYERMMRLVTEQAPDAILTLHRVAEQETRRIAEQIDRVNTGLGAVEFNRGTRLTLRATRGSCPRSPSSPRLCGPSRDASPRWGWATSRRSSTSTPTSCGCVTGWHPRRRRTKRGRATRWMCATDSRSTARSGRVTS